MSHKDPTYLMDLKNQLQALINQLNVALKHQAWHDVAELDMQVNQLVHDCVSNGHLDEPQIRGKVMLLVNLYRNVINQLQGHKQTIHDQWQKGKEQISAQKLYQDSSSACA